MTVWLILLESVAHCPEFTSISSPLVFSTYPNSVFFVKQTKEKDRSSIPFLSFLYVTIFLYSSCVNIIYPHHSPINKNLVTLPFDWAGNVGRLTVHPSKACNNAVDILLIVSSSERVHKILSVLEEQQYILHARSVQIIPA